MQFPLSDIPVTGFVLYLSYNEIIMARFADDTAVMAVRKTVENLTNGVFLDVTPCGSYNNRRFVGT
jgi:hypothetical protein